MTLIVDAGALFAQADAGDPDHGAIAALLKEERRLLVTSQVAVAKADYLIVYRLGVDVELALLDDLLRRDARVGLDPLGDDHQEALGGAPG